MSRAQMKAEIEREQDKGDAAWERRNMGALERAQGILAAYNSTVDAAMLAQLHESLQANVAVAQAEQLKRIADALYTPDYDGNITGVAKILEELNQNIARAAIY